MARQPAASTKLVSKPRMSTGVSDSKAVNPRLSSVRPPPSPLVEEARSRAGLDEAETEQIRVAERARKESLVAARGSNRPSTSYADVVKAPAPLPALKATTIKSRPSVDKHLSTTNCVNAKDRPATPGRSIGMEKSGANSATAAATNASTSSGVVDDSQPPQTNNVASDIPDIETVDTTGVSDTEVSEFERLEKAVDALGSKLLARIPQDLIVTSDLQDDEGMDVIQTDEDETMDYTPLYPSDEGQTIIVHAPSSNKGIKNKKLAKNSLKEAQLPNATTSATVEENISSQAAAETEGFGRIAAASIVSMSAATEGREEADAEAGPTPAENIMEAASATAATPMDVDEEIRTSVSKEVVTSAVSTVTVSSFVTTATASATATASTAADVTTGISSNSDAAVAAIVVTATSTNSEASCSTQDAEPTALRQKSSAPADTEEMDTQEGNSSAATSVGAVGATDTASTATATNAVQPLRRKPNNEQATRPSNMGDSRRSPITQPRASTSGQRAYRDAAPAAAEEAESDIIVVRVTPPTTSQGPTTGRTASSTISRISTVSVSSVSRTSSSNRAPIVTQPSSSMLIVSQAGGNRLPQPASVQLVLPGV